MLEDDGDEEEEVEAEMKDVVGSGDFWEMCVSIIIPLRSTLCGIARGGAVHDGIDMFHFWSPGRKRVPSRSDGLVRRQQSNRQMDL